MTSMHDFVRDDGSVDIDAWQQAGVATGERCEVCLIHLIAPESSCPGPRKCCDCRALEFPYLSLEHRIFVRCPRCAHRWTPSNVDFNEADADGSIFQNCPACEHSFRVGTRVEVFYTSPAMETKESLDG